MTTDAGDADRERPAQDGGEGEPSSPEAPGDQGDQGQPGGERLANPRPVPEGTGGPQPGSGTGIGNPDATLILAPGGQKASLPQIEGVVLEREIGRGGMGVVYRGRQGYLDRDVAVKLLLASVQGGDFAARFQREAKILASLAHPNIVGCYQAGVTGAGDGYLVMEFIDGLNLLEWIRENGPLEPRDAVALCRDLAGALGHAQESGVIHRDVKPANVLLQRQERPESESFPFRAKLADLGLARPTTSDATMMDLTVQGAVMGSPPTMAPEQFDDPESVDYRADIYGLGCVLFHALTGNLAFPQATLTATIARKMSEQGPDPRELNPDLEPELCRFVRRMLARDREHRPASYAELVTTCEELLAGKPDRTRARGKTRVAPSPKAGAAPAEAEPSRGSRKALGLAVVAVLAVGGFLAWGQLTGDDSDPSDGSVARAGSSEGTESGGGEPSIPGVVPPVVPPAGTGNAAPPDPSEHPTSDPEVEQPAPGAGAQGGESGEADPEGDLGGGEADPGHDPDIEPAPPARAAPRAGLDATGSWTLVVAEGGGELRADLAMTSEGDVTGTLELPAGRTIEVAGWLAGSLLTLTGEGEDLKLAAVFEGEGFAGDGTLPGAPGPVRFQAAPWKAPELPGPSFPAALPPPDAGALVQLFGKTLDDPLPGWTDDGSGTVWQGSGDILYGVTGSNFDGVGTAQLGLPEGDWRVTGLLQLKRNISGGFAKQAALRVELEGEDALELRVALSEGGYDAGARLLRYDRAGFDWIPRDGSPRLAELDLGGWPPNGKLAFELRWQAPVLHVTWGAEDSPDEHRSLALDTAAASLPGPPRALAIGVGEGRVLFEKFELTRP